MAHQPEEQFSPHVLIIGMSGVGAEVAKNLVLSGVTLLTVQDWINVSETDLGNHPFLRREDIGTNRAVVSGPRISALSADPNIIVNVLPNEPLFSALYMNSFNCVVVTDIIDLIKLIWINDHCRSQLPSIPFVMADVRGVFGWCFVDMGEGFTIREKPRLRINKNHLQSNTLTYEVVGSVCQPIEFTSLKMQLQKPTLNMWDWENPFNPHRAFLGMSAFHKFFATEQKYPKPWCDADAKKLVDYALVCLGDNKSEMFNVVIPDDDLPLIQLSFTGSFGRFTPLCSILGGIASHEVLNALFRRSQPLLQWFHIDAASLIDLSKLSLNSQDLNSQLFMPLGYQNDTMAMCLGHPLCKKITEQRLLMTSDKDRTGIGTELVKLCSLLAIGHINIIPTFTPEKVNAIQDNHNLQQIKAIKNDKKMRSAFMRAIQDIDRRVVIGYVNRRSTVVPDYVDPHTREIDLIINTVRGQLDILEGFASRKSPIPIIDSAVSGSIGRIVMSLISSFADDAQKLDEDILHAYRTDITLDDLNRYPVDRACPLDFVDCVKLAMTIFDAAAKSGTTLGSRYVIQQIIDSFRPPFTANDCTDLAKTDFEELFTEGPVVVNLIKQDFLHHQFIQACALYYAKVLRISDEERDEIKLQFQIDLTTETTDADRRLCFITVTSKLFARRHRIAELDEIIIRQLVVEFDLFFQTERQLGLCFNSEPSTSAVIAGLVVMEVIKIVRLKSGNYRNYLVDLASSSKITYHPVAVEIHAADDKKKVLYVHELCEIISDRFNMIPKTIICNDITIFGTNRTNNLIYNDLISDIIGTAARCVSLKVTFDQIAESKSNIAPQKVIFFL